MHVKERLWLRCGIPSIQSSQSDRNRRAEEHVPKKKKKRRRRKRTITTALNTSRNAGEGHQNDMTRVVLSSHLYWKSSLSPSRRNDSFSFSFSAVLVSLWVMALRISRSTSWDMTWNKMIRRMEIRDHFWTIRIMMKGLGKLTLFLDEIAPAVLSHILQRQPRQKTSNSFSSSELAKYIEHVKIYIWSRVRSCALLGWVQQYLEARWMKQLLQLVNLFWNFARSLLLTSISFLSFLIRRRKSYCFTGCHTCICSSSRDKRSMLVNR